LDQPFLRISITAKMRENDNETMSEMHKFKARVNEWASSTVLNETLGKSLTSEWGWVVLNFNLYIEDRTYFHRSIFHRIRVWNPRGEEVSFIEKWKMMSFRTYTRKIKEPHNQTQSHSTWSCCWVVYTAISILLVLFWPWSCLRLSGN